MKKILKAFTSLLLIFCMLIIPFETEAATSNNWVYPTTSRTVTASWPKYSSGSYHSGIDFSAPLGSPVYSTCDGEVVAVTSLTDSYGKHIKIRAVVNGATVYMRYCHLSDFAVSVGQKVAAGELIGYSGSTGNATGPHLHYEVRDANDRYGSLSSPNLNPGNYLPGTSYTFETNATPADEQNPIGVMDSCTVDSNLRSIRIYGWAYDRSDLSKSIDCTVFAKNTDGEVRVFRFTASNASSDLGISGSHRYDKTLDLTGLMGDITVELWGKNIGEGHNTLLATKNVYITTEYNPVAAVDSVTGNDDKSITITGWAYDRDNRAKSTDVIVEVTGVDITDITETFVFTADNKSSDLNTEGNHRFHETLQLQKLSGDVKVKVTAENIGKGIDTLVCEKQITVNPLFVYYNVMNPASTVIYDINSLSGKVKFRFREYTVQDCYWKTYVADELVVEHGESKSGEYEGCFVHVVDTDELIDNLISEWNAAWTEDTVQTREEYIKSKCKIKCELYTSSNKKIGETEVYFTVNNDQASGSGISTYNLDANGGSVESEAIKVAIGHAVGNRLPIPVRENYTFTGWYTAKDGGTKIADDFVASEENQCTFYAHWSCNHDYVAENTVLANCKTGGIITYTCSVCSDTYTENIGLGDHIVTTVNAIPATCTSDGLTEGKYCIICEEVFSEQSVIPMIEHEDTNNDGFCDNCESEVKQCACNCHKTGFINFLWKILNFFQRIFGLGKTCECGINHY